MTRTRYPSEPEARLVVRVLLLAVLPVAAAIAVHLCRARLERGLVQLGTSERDASRIVAVATLVLAAFAVGRLLQFLFHVLRWQRARRWERMLADPSQAALVPPLAGHTDALRHQLLRESRVQRVVVTIGLLCAAVLASSVVPRRGSADRTDLTGWQQVGLGAAIVVLAAIAGTIAAGRWRRAQRAESLSADTALAALDDEAVAPVGPSLDPAAIPPLTLAAVPPGAPIQPRAPVTPATNVFGAAPWTVLYLRLFDNDARLRAVLQGPWRACGRLHLMRAATSVSEQEIERARAGEPLFINSHEWLQRELDAEPPPTLPPGEHELTGVAAVPVRVVDPYGSFLPRPLLVHGSFWQETLDVLLDRADVVLLDLSGYQRDNVGTGYEIQRIVDRWPIDRCLLLLDAESDATFLEAQVREAWSRMAQGSPNAASPHRAVMTRTTRTEQQYALAASLQSQLAGVGRR